MSRKEFADSVVRSFLVKCRRHCCVCDKFCGGKIEIHHIGRADDNSEDNAIPVCFDCHSEIIQYNDSHPKGRKYKPDELKMLRDSTFKKYDYKSTQPNIDLTGYGQGFKDGVKWADEVRSIGQFWKFVSGCGDFAIEILWLFENSDQRTMMDETMLDSEIVTNQNISQPDGHTAAWKYGQIIGLWDIDGNDECLFITKLGKQFKYFVEKTLELKERYIILKQFWGSKPEQLVKPKSRINSPNYNIPAGFLNWLQLEKDRIVRIKGNKTDYFFISEVTSQKLTLKDFNNGSEIELNNDSIIDVQIDHSTGELIIIRNKA